MDIYKINPSALFTDEQAHKVAIMEEDGFSLQAFYFTDAHIQMFKKHLKGHTCVSIYPCGKVYSKTRFTKPCTIRPDKTAHKPQERCIPY